MFKKNYCCHLCNRLFGFGQGCEAGSGKNTNGDGEFGQGFLKLETCTEERGMYKGKNASVI